jgi:hypothetical protein
VGFRRCPGAQQLGWHPRRCPPPPPEGDLPEDGMLYAGETKLKSQTQYKKWQMKGRIAYRCFQKPWNRRLAGGVEPLGAAALLTPTNEAGDGSEPAVAAPLSVFFSASSEAFFFAATSSVASSSTPPLRRPSSSQPPPRRPSSPPLRRTFFLPPLLRAPLLRPHPQPLSLQRPLLPSPCRLQPRCHWTPGHHCPCRC